MLLIFSMTGVNFTGRWIGRGGTNVWPSCSPDFVPLDFCLWGYMKGQVYSHRMNILDELKVWITAVVANVPKDMLQCGMYTKLEMALIVRCFAPNNFSLCKRKLFQLLNKLLQTAPAHLFFIFKLQMPEILALFLVDSV
jgi:hypothetical protein